MKKFSKLFLAMTLLSVFAISGCGGEDTTVIEAPDAPTEDSSMEGISDEEYDKAMEADMQ